MSIGELARRTRLTPDVLRVWERRYGLLQPRRTAGNRRLYSRADQARVSLMQRYIAAGKPPAHAAEIVCARQVSIDVGDAPAVASHEVEAAHEELRQALDRFQESPAQRVLERLFLVHSRLAVIRDVLLPYLRAVGERWADGHLNVAQEHFTSIFLEARFMAMARGWDRGAGPRALLACAPGERHVFGLISFGIALHDLGWRITYLGADVPIEMVHYAATRVAPSLIALSAVVPERFDQESGLRTLTRRWTCGLAGAGATRERCDRVGARHLAQDPIRAARGC
jgi:MerR family transcriptional regulator, light-induced transcriptional regulator